MDTFLFLKVQLAQKLGKITDSTNNNVTREEVGEGDWRCRHRTAWSSPATTPRRVRQQATLEHAPRVLCPTGWVCAWETLFCIDGTLVLAIEARPTTRHSATQTDAAVVASVVAAETLTEGILHDSCCSDTV